MTGAEAGKEGGGLPSHVLDVDYPLEERPIETEPSAAPASAERAHVVILVHGINTVARWQNEISEALRDHNFIPQPIGYGIYGIVRFLMPSRSLKNHGDVAITAVSAANHHAPPVATPRAIAMRTATAL